MFIVKMLRFETYEFSRYHRVVNGFFRDEDIEVRNPFPALSGWKRNFCFRKIGYVDAMLTQQSEVIECNSE